MEPSRPQRLVLLGHSISGSLSPAIQNAALSAASIDVRYELLDVPRSALTDTISILRRQKAAGNVTIPYKEAFLDSCDRLSDTARAVRAVNTFWTAIDGALVGDNTDVVGFRKAAGDLIGIARDGERVALIGAGGAAAAVLHAMEGWPNVRVRVYNRSRERAERLIRRFQLSAELAPSPEVAVEDATLVVNATPVGMRGDSVALAVEMLPGACAVLDLAYGADETRLVREARARGHRAMDGLTMLIEQGAAAFERWFGVTPDRDAMWSAVRSKR